jgi:hypothetical protein
MKTIQKVTRTALFGNVLCERRNRYGRQRQ